MELCFQAGGPSKWSTEALIILCFEDEVPEVVYPRLFEVALWLKNSKVLSDRKGKKGEIIVGYSPSLSAIPRIIFVGLGKRKDLTPIKTLEILRSAIGKASLCCRELGVENFATLVTPLKRFGEDLGQIVEEVVCAAGLSLYRYMACKSDLEKEEISLDPQWFGLFFCEDVVDKDICNAARRGEIQVKAINLARDLANTPANRLTPKKISEEAISMAKRYGLNYEIFDREAIISEGMGAFASVAAGSIHEPQLIMLEYTSPEYKDSEPLIFVGKGITFDSGGISIKPAAKMWEMKSDMSGAGAILGLFEALGQLKLPVRVIGLLACAENMPDSNASRPGDVVVSLSGKTVEIVNTDAEGRLVLCDTLTYAQNRWTPSMLVDVATLTGACVVALGDDVAGVFCKNTSFVDHICELGDMVGEPFWPLPLDDRYFESLKSETADFTNAGGREGGASSAAIFLKQFVKDTTLWAHLDIAGPGFISKKNDLCPAGGTGFSVRTLLALVTYHTMKEKKSFL